MATPFIPLLSEAFPEAARPSIERLNVFLLELSRLEGTIRQPLSSRRSDQSVARRSTVQVDISRITPSVAQVVSGASTVVGTPALVLGTVNTVGSTTTALSINSAVALFGAQPPMNLSGTSAVGTSAFAARADHVHDAFDTTAPSALAATAATGSADFATRRDHVHEFPPTLQSTANDSTLTLTDDATDQTLTGSLGDLLIAPADGVQIRFPNTAGANFILISGSTTAATPTMSIQGRPTAGSRTLLVPNWFGAAASDIFSSQTFRAWDSQFSTWVSGQITSCGIVTYDASNVTIAPSSGSSSGNNLYAFRCNSFQINNANGSWADAATAYFRGVRRSITSPFIDVQATVIIEPPTAGLSAQLITVGSSQIGLYIRQQAAQATAADRIAIKVDAQNSGTRRWSFYGVSDTLYQGGNVDCIGLLGVTGIATFGSSISVAGTMRHRGTYASLYGATPTVQFGTTGTTTGFAVGTSTAVTVDSTYTGNTGTLAYTIGDIVRALKLIGAVAY